MVEGIRIPKYLNVLNRSGYPLIRDVSFNDYILDAILGDGWEVTFNEKQDETVSYHPKLMNKNQIWSIMDVCYVINMVLNILCTSLYILLTF